MSECPTPFCDAEAEVIEREIAEFTQVGFGLDGFEDEEPERMPFEMVKLRCSAGHLFWGPTEALESRRAHKKEVEAQHGERP